MTSSIGELHFVRPGQARTVKLIVLPGKPLGGAVIDEDGGVGLAGYLRKNSCANVVDRILYAVSADPITVERVREALRERGTMRMVGEPAWLEIPGSIELDPLVVFLLTREQHNRAQERVASRQDGLLQLGNGQTVLPEDRNKPYRKIPHRWADGYNGVSPDGVEFLQTIDSSPFADVLDNPHSYFAILSPQAVLNHGTGWVKVSNPVTAAPPDDRGQGVKYNADLTPSFAVQTIFSDRVRPLEIVLDETVSVAIGMREGEVVRFQSIDPKVGTFRRRAFSFRHTVVRAVSSTTMDMEKPLVRLPAGVLDILGVNSGSRLVVEGLSWEDDQIRRISVRALEARELDGPRMGGVLDILDITGSVDIPAMTMDLSLRNRLGIRRGDPVYVRPEFGSVLFDEFTTVSFALLAAAVGSFVANAQALAAGITAVYLAMSVAGVWRKFR